MFKYDAYKGQNFRELRLNGSNCLCDWLKYALINLASILFTPNSLSGMLGTYR